MSNLSSRLELILNNSHHTIIAPLLWALSLHAQINLSENLYKKIYQIINTCSENFTISDCALISQTLLNIKYQISPHDLEENALGRIYKNGQIFENKYMSVNNKWYLDNYGYDIHQLFIQAMKSQLENFREKQFIEEYILDNLYVLPLFSQKYKIAYILVNKFDFIENGERNGNIYIYMWCIGYARLKYEYLLKSGIELIEIQHDNLANWIETLPIEQLTKKLYSLLPNL